MKKEVLLFYYVRYCKNFPYINQYISYLKTSLKNNHEYHHLNIVNPQQAHTN